MYQVTSLSPLEFGRSPPSSPLKEFETEEPVDDEAVLEYCHAAGDYQQGLFITDDNPFHEVKWHPCECVACESLEGVG